MYAIHPAYVRPNYRLSKGPHDLYELEREVGGILPGELTRGLKYKRTDWGRIATVVTIGVLLGVFAYCAMSLVLIAWGE